MASNDKWMQRRYNIIIYLYIHVTLKYDIIRISVNFVIVAISMIFIYYSVTTAAIVISKQLAS
jgi:hypothetical protein